MRLLVAQFVLCFFVFSSLSVFANIEASDSVVQISESEGSVIKTPEGDSRFYRYITLDNGLRVVLVSDSQTKKAAASLDVHVGSVDSPRDKMGLAHFLEHMLFLGTEKYPTAGEYQDFIKAKGGSHNAYTSFEHTNYYFDITANNFESALDRFAQFFTAPLLNDEYVGREKNAVHSEYTAKLKQDGRRSLDVYKTVINPKHRVSIFSVGNLETLSEDQPGELQAHLKSFHQKHYYANNMALSVLGPQSLDHLQQLVELGFAKIPSQSVGPDNDSSDSKSIPLFEKGQLPLGVELEPVKDIKRLTLKFPLPPVKSLWQEKPLNYIGFFLGHEGEGSLLAILKEKGWAQRLSAGKSDSASDYSTFNIDIGLTDKGLENRDRVIEYVFSAVRQLEKKGIKEWRFDELKTMSDLEFRFAEQSSEVYTVIGLSSAIHDYPVSELVRAPYLLSRFNSDNIRELLKLISPNNLLLMLAHKNVETDQVTKFYQVPYRQYKFSKKQLRQWKKARKSTKSSTGLKLPKKNAYIPSSVEWRHPPEREQAKVSQVIPKPELLGLKNLPHVQAWYQHNNEFTLPKVDYRVRLYSPVVGDSASGSARAAAANQLMVMALSDQLNTLTYTAAMAGLGVGLIPHTRGMDIQLNGFDQKMPLLLQQVIESLKKPEWDEARFQDLKKDLLRKWRNSEQEMPYRQLLSEIVELTYSKVWSETELLAAAESLTFKDIQSFSKEYFKNNQVKALLYGNLTRRQAGEWLLPLRELLEVESTEEAGHQSEALNHGRIAKLPEKTFWRNLDLNHKDQAAIYFIQGHDDSLKEQASMMVLQQIMESPFYHEMRTEKQLGYMVFTTAMPVRRLTGTAMVIQSPVASTSVLMSEMQGFVKRFEKYLPKSDFETHKNSVLFNLREPAKNMGHRAGIFWADLGLGFHGFDRRQQLIYEVESLTLDQLQDFYRTRFLQKPRALWLTSGDSLEGLPKIDDVVDFKNQHLFYENH